MPGILQHLGIDDYLDAIFFSAQIVYEKPNPDASRIVLAAFPRANPVWIIGDSPEPDLNGGDQTACDPFRYASHLLG
jgi:FMN phosphatase YigB (HAD superfamily)